MRQRNNRLWFVRSLYSVHGFGGTLRFLAINVLSRALDALYRAEREAERNRTYESGAFGVGEFV